MCSRSTDITAAALEELIYGLNQIGTKHSIVSVGNPEPWDHVNHIQMHAELREHALQPLRSGLIRPDFIFFVNDVVFCLCDMLEMMHQQHKQNASITCALDWVHYKNNWIIYDSWVLRDINGYALDFNDSIAITNLKARIPFQVRCGLPVNNVNIRLTRFILAGTE